MPVHVPPMPFLRRRMPRASTPPPGAPLTLVAGVYLAGTYRLLLTFDRAVDVTAFNGTVVFVDDPVDNDERLDGTGGATLTAPETVEVALVGIAGGSGTQVLLDAAANNGIVAADDGGAWAGVTDYVLQVP